MDKKEALLRQCTKRFLEASAAFAVANGEPLRAEEMTVAMYEESKGVIAPIIAPIIDYVLGLAGKTPDDLDVEDLALPIPLDIRAPAV